MFVLIATLNFIEEIQQLSISLSSVTMFSNVRFINRPLSPRPGSSFILHAVGRRFQSSITFQNNQILLKQNLKQSKLKGKRSKHKYDRDMNECNNSEASDSKSAMKDINDTNEINTTKAVTKKLPRDYSWLPRVPTTDHVLREQFNSDMLYSGYRPIVIGDKNAKEDKLMQFAMKLEKLSEPVPWVSSATGQEFFSEWDNVPSDVIKDLKPFHPPSVEETNNLKDKEAKEKLQRQILLNEQDKLINRKRGRKKPIIRLLDLKRKFNKND